MTPFDSWLVLHGVRTFALRMEKAQENAFYLVKWLEGQEKITKLIYPGLASHPWHEIMKKQCRGFGAIIAF